MHPICIRVIELLTNHDTPINTQKYVLGEFHSNLDMNEGITWKFMPKYVIT